MNRANRQLTNAKVRAVVLWGMCLLFGYAREASAADVVEIGTNVPAIPLLVVPNYLKTNDVVFGGGTLHYRLRSQQVYRNTEFPAQPIRIKELRFRPDRVWGYAFSTVISNLQVHLSTTTKDPSGLSATYAENTGPDETNVYSGSLAISSQFTGPADGPKDFDMVIPLQVPFVYNPAEGNLLLDIRNFNDSGAAALSGIGGLPSGSRAWGLDVNSPTAPYVENGVDALGIVYEPVEPAGAAIPQILTQPGSQTVYVGDQVTLSVTATGPAPLSYQWWFGGNALSTRTNASLLLSNVQVSDAGNYWVTVSNLAGGVTSSNAILSVLIPECTPAQAGLVGWWPGEESPADVVATNHMEVSGGANYAAGKVGVGFEFRSYTNFARIPASPQSDVGAGAGFTIEGWIFPRSVAGFHPMWEWNTGALGGPSIGTHFWINHLPQNSGELFAGIIGADDSQHTLSTATGIVVPNVWQHVALTYDKSSGIGRILRNGQVVAESNLGSFTPKTASDVYIGRRPSDYPGDWTYNAWFDGVLDELSLYNRALTTNEIAAIYAARGEGKCVPPPVVVAVTPPNALVNEGGTASFTASASGVGPLSYQWQHGGVDLAGANAATLILSNVVYAQAGNYRIAVSNAGGVTLSSNAVLAVNRLPLADAGATDKLLISPNGSNVVAVLDGSLSSDPDGNALTYSWFHTGDGSPFATGVVAVTTLPDGTNGLTLVVNDGMASGSQAFAVEVITTAEAVDRLLTLVQTDVPKANALAASLRAALASIDRSQPQTAINQLEAFIHKVHAQLEPSDPALAAQLIADTQAIIDALNGGGAPAQAVAVEIASITQGNNGKPHLKIKGVAGRVHVVETSTDMVNWLKVGVAGPTGTGDYQFDDVQAPSVGARYYRVVSPK